MPFLAAAVLAMTTILPFPPSDQALLDRAAAFVAWADQVREGSEYVMALQRAEALQADKARDAARPTLRPSSVPSPVPGDVWWQLALCESGGRQDAYNPGGPYLSYFQWLQSTWQSVGGTGDPRYASYEEQRMRAQMLQQRSGFASQWPACSAKLGL